MSDENTINITEEDVVENNEIENNDEIENQFSREIPTNQKDADNELFSNKEITITSKF